MPRPVSTPRSRVLTIALLGVVGLAISARPASAAGCHVEDRPALGLSSAVEPEASAWSDRIVGARVRPVPCSDGVPGPSLAKAPSHPLAVAILSPRSAAGSPSRRALDEPAVRPHHVAAPPDRPPRPIRSES